MTSRAKAAYGIDPKVQDLNAEKKKIQAIEHKKLMVEQARQAALLIDIEYGIVEEIAEVRPPSIYSRIFPPPTQCVDYKGVAVFKSKLSMQSYLKRNLIEGEWERNASLIEDIRKEIIETDYADLKPLRMTTNL